MSPRFVLLVLLSVALSAAAQLLLKFGMSNATVQDALTRAYPLETVRAVATNGYIAAGLTLYVLSVAAWLLVLARVDVSAAYPWVGLGFVLTMAFGALLLHEPVGLLRVTGTTLVCAGVYLIARS